MDVKKNISKQKNDITLKFPVLLVNLRICNDWFSNNIFNWMLLYRWKILHLTFSYLPLNSAALLIFFYFSRVPNFLWYSLMHIMFFTTCILLFLVRQHVDHPVWIIYVSMRTVIFLIYPWINGVSWRKNDKVIFVCYSIQNRV